MTNDKLTKIIRETISLFRASLMQDTENDDPSDDVIVHGFATLCHYVAECRDTARAAIAAKRKTLDRRTRDNVRDVVTAQTRFERIQQDISQVYGTVSIASTIAIPYLSVSWYGVFSVHRQHYH